MRHVVMHIRAEHVQPEAAYTRISDFARYPELTETVLALELEPAQADGSVISSWLVRFRKGTLRWTERDVLDPIARRIEFAQISGDFLTMEGSWQLDPEPDRDGVLIRFETRFDLGIPSLAEILDPVAESTLRSNIVLILTGLLGSVVDVGPLNEPV
ncbi:ribosome-associated toxin RatA of RatAB toxin-antitoxin module [Rhodococcus sp. AG1013]|uniref:SRPBCC family protein n=1 Tax=Rhodococcus sp. AG1013 TaxID=2183996 RepID=UPI000E0A44FD|nr:SRPBCC family protein [Rhodococcus sp. AG1013]RDI35589.1 ribosome-associated toxin RatA of RatAB toxin-antitoxin module [Rhodococcus sp. AG1013]